LEEATTVMLFDTLVKSQWSIVGQRVVIAYISSRMLMFWNGTNARVNQPIAATVIGSSD